jgi:hypothetical protein
MSTPNPLEPTPHKRPTVWIAAKQELQTIAGNCKPVAAS